MTNKISLIEGSVFLNKRKKNQNLLHLEGRAPLLKRKRQKKLKNNKRERERERERETGGLFKAIKIKGLKKTFKKRLINYITLN